MSSSFKSKTQRFLSPAPQLRESNAPVNRRLPEASSATRKNSSVPVSSSAFCTRDVLTHSHSIVLPWEQTPVQIPSETKESLSAVAASVLRDVSKSQDKTHALQHLGSKSLAPSASAKKEGVVHHGMAPAFDENVLRSSSVGCIFSTGDQLHLTFTSDSQAGVDSGRQSGTSGSSVANLQTPGSQREYAISPLTAGEGWRQTELAAADEHLGVHVAKTEVNLTTETGMTGTDQRLDFFDLRDTDLARMCVVSRDSPERERESLGSLCEDTSADIASPMQFVPVMELKIPAIPARSVLFVREDWTWSTWLAFLTILLTGRTSAQALGLHALRAPSPMPQGLQPGTILHDYVEELRRADLTPRAFSNPDARDILRKALVASGERNLLGLMMQVALPLLNALLNRTWGLGYRPLSV